MRYRIAIGLALVVLAAVVPASVTATHGGDCSFPVERTDATGEVVRVTERPDRIVTLSPSAAQTVWEIGAWDRVVGATEHASNLEGYDQLERSVATAGGSVDAESVVGLEPDLALAPYVVSNETVRALRRANVTVYRFHEAATVAEIQAKTSVTGRLTGACEGADETVAWTE